MGENQLLSEDQKIENWRSANIWLVSLFYFFQGICNSGMGIYSYAAMANWDIPAGVQTTVIAILGLPLYLAVFPGLLSDRVPIGKWGRRKPYIALGGLLYIPSYALLIVNQQFGASWVGSIILFLIAWLLVDTSLDAMTVDITPQNRLAQVQSAARASRLVGTGLASLAVPMLGPRLGWPSVLLLLGNFALLQSLAAILFKEVPLSLEALRAVQAPLGRMIRHIFGNRLVWYSLLFFFFFSASQGFGPLINIYLLTELGWGKDPHQMQIFGLLLFTNTLAAVAGALLGGRLHPKVLLSLRFFTVFLVVCWISILPWLLVHQSPDDLTLIFSARVLMGTLMGFGSVLGLTLMMRLSPRTNEGFMFALLGSAGSLGNNTLESKTVTAFSTRLGGLIPAFFTLIPYGFISLFFLRYLLRTLDPSRPEADSIPYAG